MINFATTRGQNKTSICENKLRRKSSRFFQSFTSFFFRNKRLSPSPKQKKPLYKGPIEPVHDLEAIYQEVNQLYFAGKLSLAIDWSYRRHSPGRRSRRLGSYCLRRKRILIDGKLNRAVFPKEFISFLVYHEMLHSVLPPFINKAGRRAIHHRAFREQEQAFKGYAEIKAWEKAHAHLFFEKPSL